MRRREVIAGLAAVAAVWPLWAAAQQKALPVIGWLSSNSAEPGAAGLAGFLAGLRDAGLIVGQNVAIEYRWADGAYDRLDALAAELAERRVDVIVASGGPAPALAAKKATSAIPIVFASGGDPVADGLVASLARPGGTITGISFLVFELSAKRLELLSELAPQARVIGLLVNPGNPNAQRNIAAVEAAARARGAQLAILKGVGESDIDAAFATLGRLHAGGLVVGADPVFAIRRAQIIALSARDALPTIYYSREDAAAGGLISYGSSISAAYRQAGVYAAKILAGASPADLPVQQPTTFELILNLKTAKALGLVVPQALLQRADEVIE